MTPTATYIAEENCLQELPRMERPLLYDVWIQFKATKKILVVTDEQAKAIKNYDNHLATLRKIPCDPSCKGLWADQQKVAVGKDYQVKKRCSPQKYCNVNGCDYCVDTAFPLVPVKSEDELWEEVEKLITVNSNWQIPEIIRVVKLLKSKYSLTKR